METANTIKKFKILLRVDGGIKIHKYGPHLFHTSNHKVVEWLSKYTEWIPYKHKVKALLDSGKYVTLPVNKETIEIVGKEKIIDVFFSTIYQENVGD